MSGIGKVDMWYDVHYIETSTEIPPKGHVLPTPDITLEGPFNPSKGREFSELRVELPFSEVLDITYLRLYYDFNNGESQVFYAWVDDIKLMSDSENAPMVNIVYHIDLWRTYNQYFTYGSGFVVRRPSVNTDYWQNYAYRYLRKTSDTIVTQRYKDIIWWVIIAFQHREDDGKRTTSSQFYVFPLSLNQEQRYYVHNRWASEFPVGICPNFSEVIQCKFDEWLSIDPEAISGAWISPICPISHELMGTGTESDPLDLTINASNWNMVRKERGAKLHDCIVFTSTFQALTLAGKEHCFAEQDFDCDFVSTETKQYNLAGPMGEIIGAFPFGMHITHAHISFVASSTTAYIRFKFGEYSEGLVYDYILPSIDVNSNSWSSYVYSGQRDYDIRTRSLQTAATGIEGVLSGGYMGGILGAGTRNSAVPGKNRKGTEEITKGLSDLIPAFAGLGLAGDILVGAGIGMGTSLISSSIQGMVIDPRLQEANDAYHSHQTPTVLLAGDPYFVLTFTDGFIHLITMEPDETSCTIIEENKAVQGVKYGQSISNCTDLIEGGGPMQINNLIITGNAPIMAKKAIQAKFAAGVRIVSR